MDLSSLYKVKSETERLGFSLTYVTCSAVANQMKNQSPQGGSIIGISSISALVGGEYQWYVVQFHWYAKFWLQSNASHYTPTKAGILSLMQSCAVALGKYNIRANAILPGTIDTDINKEDLANDEKRQSMVKRTALGRLGGKFG
jgi:L-rhamnose 1-dehydrogenase